MTDTVDTSAEAVERLATLLLAPDWSSKRQDTAATLLRALAAERDALQNQRSLALKEAANLVAEYAVTLPRDLWRNDECIKVWAKCLRALMLLAEGQKP